MNAYWKIGLIIGWGAIAFSTGWMIHGWLDDLTAAKLNEAQQNATIAAQTDATAQEHKAETFTIGVSDDYEKKLTAIDSRYSAFGLQFPANGAFGDLPATATGASGYHAATCPNRLSGGAQQNLVALMKQADIQTARLAACQEWIRAQGEYAAPR